MKSFHRLIKNVINGFQLTSRSPHASFVQIILNMTKLNIDKIRALFLRFRAIHEKDFPSARTVVV